MVRENVPCIFILRLFVKKDSRLSINSIKFFASQNDIENLGFVVILPTQYT